VLIQPLTGAVMTHADSKMSVNRIRLMVSVLAFLTLFVLSLSAQEKPDKQDSQRVNRFG
jgi:hypothetical protein